MTASCWESTARMARLKPEASYWAKLQWVAQVHCYQSLTRIQRTVEIMSFSRGHRPCCCFFLIFIVFVFVFFNAPFLSRWLLPLVGFFFEGRSLPVIVTAKRKPIGSVAVTTAVLLMCASYFGRFYLLLFSHWTTTGLVLASFKHESAVHSAAQSQ